jgi:hypothetical protein
MIRVPEFFVDAQGHKMARISLANSELCAILYKEDFGELLERGFSMLWKLNAGGVGRPPYVRCTGPNGVNPIVARLIAGAGPGTQVHYRDRNRLNLRSENLRVQKGGNAKHDCAIMEIEAGT